MYLALFFIIFSTNAFAVEVLKIDNDFSEKNPGKYLYYYVDDSTKLDIYEIMSRDDILFKYLGKNYTSFGYSTSAIWFRLVVENQRDNPDWFLEYKYPIIDEIDFYYRDKNNGEIVHYRAGDRIAYHNRPIDYMVPIFPICNQKGMQTYYFRVKSEGSLTVFTSAWVSKSYYGKKKYELFLNFIFYGIILSFILFNLFIYYSFRDNSFIHLVLFSIFTMMYSFVDTGLSFQLFLSNSPYIANIIHPIFLILSVAYANQFSRSFLNYKDKYPKLDSVQKYFFYISFILLILTFFTKYSYSTRFSTIYTLLSMLLLIFVGSYLSIKGSRRARYLMFAWLIMLLSGIISSLRAFGFFPIYFSAAFAAQFGATAAIFLLNIGVAERINRLKKDLMNLNTSLEVKVKSRTNELQQTMDEIEHINEFLSITNEKLESSYHESERDMDMAGNLQKSFLPPKSGKIDGWDISVYFNPLMRVSGDFYDVYIKDGRLHGAGLFDVSGHGISSGLLTLMAKSIFENRFNKGISKKSHLSEIVENANKILLKELGDVDNYITGVLLKFNDNQVEYVNAGHVEIIHGIVSEKSAKRVVSNINKNEVSGMFLGMEGMDFPYYQEDLTIEVDDSLLLFSDCLIETRNIDGERYGYERIEKKYSESLGLDADLIVNSIIKDFNAFSSGTVLEDDLTVMLLKKTS